MDWQKIETAPKDGTEVLVWSDYYGGARTAMWRTKEQLPSVFANDAFEGKWCECPYYQHDPEWYPYRPLHDVTHWMPLPAAPVI